MSNTISLENGIVAILNSKGQIRGTGFLVTKRLITTCAHVVVDAGSGPGKTLTVYFQQIGETRSTTVLEGFWRPRKVGSEDIAILELDGELPEGTQILPLRSYTNKPQAFVSYGYPEMGDYIGIIASGIIEGLAPKMDGRWMLQLTSQQIEGGFSGAPVWDPNHYRVLGIISEIWTPKTGGRNIYTSFAIPAEMIHTTCGEIPLDPPPTLARLHNVLNLPRHYLPRDDDLVHVKAEVLSMNDKKGFSRINVVGVQGMGGIGKSVFVSALVRDEEIRRTFADGIVWLSISQTPNLKARQEDLAFAITGEKQEFTDEIQGKTILAHLTTDRALLVILDDVWQLRHVVPFDVLGENGRILLTTQNSDLVNDLDARLYSLPELSTSQALDLLSKWSEQTVSQMPAEALEIVHTCGRLPLALSMVGALLRGKPDKWVNILKKLRNADFSLIDKQFPDYPYPNLIQAIQVSVNGLVPDVRTRYMDLAVLPDGLSIPEGVFRIYWEHYGLDSYDVQFVLENLISRALLSRNEAGVGVTFLL